jgi:hypothetical protein
MTTLCLMVHALEGDTAKLKDVLAQVQNVPIFDVN